MFICDFKLVLVIFVSYAVRKEGEGGERSKFCGWGGGLWGGEGKSWVPIQGRGDGPFPLTAAKRSEEGQNCRDVERMTGFGAREVVGV